MQLNGVACNSVALGAMVTGAFGQPPFVDDTVSNVHLTLVGLRTRVFWVWIGSKADWAMRAAATGCTPVLLVIHR